MLDGQSHMHRTLLRAAVPGAAAACAYAGWSRSQLRRREEDLTAHTRDVDCLVIGGGIVGASVACELSRRGASTVLLERGTCGGEASGLSAGTIWNAGVPQHTTDQNFACFLRARSTELLRELDANECVEFNQCGALDVATTADEVRFARRDYEACREQGLQVEWVEGRTALAAIEPALSGGSALAAVHTPLSGSVQPALATRAVAAAAVAAGCAVVEGAEAISVVRVPHSRHGHVYRVHTASGTTHDAVHLVLAAGAWAAPLAGAVGVTLPVVPVKGVISTSPAPPGALRKVLFEVGSRSHFDTHGDGRDDSTSTPAKCTHDALGVRRCRKLYGKQCGPSDDHQLVFGGDRLPNVGSCDYTVPPTSELHVRHHAHELMPGMREALLTADEAGSWAGLMPFSADGRPIVGECDSLGLSNLWLACGFGPSGIMEGPAAAKMLATRVAARIDAARPATPHAAPKETAASAQGKPRRVASAVDEGEAAHVAMAAMDPCRPGCCTAAPPRVAMGA